MLDQIRVNGEKKELVDEVVALAKKYGITTPYTSYLIVPDAAVPVAQERRRTASRTCRSAPRCRPHRRGLAPAQARAGCGVATSRFRWRNSPSRTSRSRAIWQHNRGAYADRNWIGKDDAERTKPTARPTGSQGQEGAYDAGPRAAASTEAGGGAGRQARRRSVAARRPTSATSRELDQTAFEERLRSQLPGVRRRLDRRGLRRQDADADRQGPERRLLQAAGTACRRSRTCCRSATTSSG